MTDLLQIKLANQLPLNRAAKEFLPKDWQGDHTEMHVLSLMRWGLENGLEHWLEETTRLRKGPTPEQVEARINRLAQMEPRKAMQFLTDPENTGEVMLYAEDLLKQEGPLNAASLLLETLYDNMVATAP